MDPNQVIREKIKEAPEDIKKVFISNSWLSVIENIVQTNNLSPDQKTTLEDETLFILLRMELVTNFEKNIRENAGVSEQVAKNISNEIYEKIFKDVEEFLPKEMEAEDTEQEETNALEITPEILPEIPPEDLPTIIPEEKVHEVVVNQRPATNNQPPQNIPVAEEKKPEMVQKITSYPTGLDPYREPIQ